jgi:formylmethanofuran--tetrahydromethanopterin N-formyltransferase
MVRAVGGGNLIVLGTTRAEVLRATEHAVSAMRKLPNVILPFPGGIVRSGSKVGSRYKGLIASTNHAYCPTLKGLVASRLEAGTECVLEIVIDGLTADDVAAAMRAGIAALCEVGAAGGVHAISAGNYGGKLGPFHFHLRELAP